MQSQKEWEVSRLEDKLIELLSTFGYPIIRQGSLGADEAYPDTFFTFWNNSEFEQSAYDNETVNVVSDFDVNAYSTDSTTAYDLLTSARKLLKNNGFVAPTRGYDVMSDESTHTGRGMNVQCSTLIKHTTPQILDDISEELEEIIELQNDILGG